MAEHTLYGKKKLCYTEVTDFTDFQGIGKDPLYKRFDSVYSVITKNIEPQYRDFLAHPIYSFDEDQITWYVREWNSTPCAFNNLSDADKTKYAAIKEKTIAAYEKVRTNVTGEDKQILTGALKYIDEEFMFCYDDKVVVVAWGMYPDSHKHLVKGAVIHDLKIQSSHKVKFIAGENGVLSDKLAGVVSRPDGAILTHVDLPIVVPKKGYAFSRWEPNPLGMKVNGPLTFNAIYDEVPIEEEDTHIETVNVSFVASDGGSLIGTTEYAIEKGKTISKTEIPTPNPLSGYSFVGWNLQTDSPIEEDTTFRALFSRDNVICRFDAGEHGDIEGADSFSLPYGAMFNKDNAPSVKAKRGYKFIGWDKSPIDFVLNDDTTFSAQYEEEIPWYKHLWSQLARLWTLLTGKGCLKWLLWLLLFVLFLLLLSSILRCCGSLIENDTVAPAPVIEMPDGRTIDNNGPIKGIVGDDGSLPDNNIVAPIVGEDGKEPPIVSNPGAPDIVANRLNIYFEDADVNLELFVSDLSKVYSENECQVIGIDRNVPMIQILILENLRDVIRENLNSQLPNYEFFIVDESIFTLVGNATTDTANAGWHLDAIDVEEGWQITKGSPNITVAVVDDGIDASHDILKGRIVSPYNVFTQDNRLSVGKGHGTHVAGLAVGSDKMFNHGVSGVAPKCKLMPIQVFDNELCTFSSITSGIMYAIHHGANVVNVSIGPNFRGLDILPLPDQEYIARTQFKNEERVWRRVISVANEHNVIIVFAVGNDNILANIPPENRTNLTVNVAAVDRQIKGTNFTNYGRGSNISAPGKDIRSSVPVNKYAVFDGTSMAAPIVSGTVALMKSLDPEIPVTDILRILQATGEQISDSMPPMIQVDDALIALKTGVIPERPLPGRENSDVDANSQNEDIPANGGHPNPGQNIQDPGNYDNPTSPGIGNDKISPPASDSERDDTDYDAIRKLIEQYKRKISELERLLPENR
ncbi:MAG: S8 family serine peptidase [Alistipes sp.]|nr:S8 family serine peptidase [Alistipes sp.]